MMSVRRKCGWNWSLRYAWHNSNMWIKNYLNYNSGIQFIYFYIKFRLINFNWSKRIKLSILEISVNLTRKLRRILSFEFVSTLTHNMLGLKSTMNVSNQSDLLILYFTNSFNIRLLIILALWLLKLLTFWRLNLVAV